jgi:hypothetical protein
MWKFWRILPQKLAKLVEITLEKHTFSKFPRFLGQNKRKFAPKRIGKAGQLKSLKKRAVSASPEFNNLFSWHGHS